MTFYVTFNSFVAQLASEIYLNALFKFHAHIFFTKHLEPHASFIPATQVSILF